MWSKPTIVYILQRCLALLRWLLSLLLLLSSSLRIICPSTSFTLFFCMIVFVLFVSYFVFVYLYCFWRVKKIANSDCLLRHFCLSAWKKSAPQRSDFRDILYLGIFRKSVDKIKVSLKSDMNNGYFTWRPIYIFITLPAFLLIMRNFWDRSCRENQSTHFRVSNDLFRNSCRHDIMWKKKYCRAWQTTDDTTAHAHWMLDT